MLLLSLNFLACDTDVSSTELIDPHCEETITDINVDDNVLGISINDWFNSRPLNSSTNITWENAPNDPECLYYLFYPDDSSSQLIESTFVAGNTGIEIAVECEDYLQVSGTLSMSNENGIIDFDANVPVTIFIYPEAGSLPAEVSFSADISINELQDIIDVDDFVDTTAYHQVFVSFQGSIGTDLQASLSIQGESTMGESVSLSNIPIASFGDTDSNLVCDTFE